LKTIVKISTTQNPPKYAISKLKIQKTLKLIPCSTPLRTPTQYITCSCSSIECSKNYGEWGNSTPPLNQLSSNFVHLTMSRISKHRQNFILIPAGVYSPHVREVMHPFTWLCFCLFGPMSLPTAKVPAQILMHNAAKDVLPHKHRKTKFNLQTPFPQNCQFWDLFWWLRKFSTKNSLIIGMLKPVAQSDVVLFPAESVCTKPLLFITLNILSCNYREHLHIIMTYLVEVWVHLSARQLENNCRYLLSAWQSRRLEKNLGWVCMSRSQIEFIFQRVQGHSITLWAILLQVSK